MHRSLQEIVAAAAAFTERVAPADAVRLIGDPDTVFVDVREPPEIAQSGSVRGALRVPRGVLEFKADPANPAAEPALSSDKKVVVFCASGARAALAAKSLHDMGFERVAHISGGGFEALKQAGAPIDR
ncbi:MAG: rhodanese-like domain-containing protein [Betaproteobacteria bacterium]|nr:rhodanese-like domain-containing protein [Betaproteobacteria bacterium]